MINVHLAVSLATHLTASITLQYSFSDLTPSSGAATFPVA
jgi:hypothetical protein